MKIGRAELINDDCETALKAITDIDVIFTDPPYGTNCGGKGHKGVVGGRSKGKKGGWSCTQFKKTDWDNAPPRAEWFDWMRDISKYQMFFGGNYFALPPTQCWLIWDKVNNGKFADAELIWTNLTTPVRIKKYLWNGMARDSTAKDEKRVHISQKPIKVCEWALGFLPKGCKKIVDPYMGSGSLGIAATNMGYEYIGIERDEDHFRAACDRLEVSQRQDDFFGYDI